jgi:uncharacterized lipoprotein YmbA
MKALVLTVALATLFACSSPPIPHSRYLMRGHEASGLQPLASPATVGIRRIVVAPYLQNPGLVIETEPGEVRGARYHEWAEPLDQGVRRYLRAELSSLLSQDVDSNPSLSRQWSHAIDVSIDQLHGTASGEALLVAGWRITDIRQSREMARFRFVERVPLQSDGYAELARAELALLSKLAAVISDSIRELQ